MDQQKTMNQRTIGDLPPEMLSAMLKHLSLNDRVSLRSVCKLWNELIPTMRIERLFVAENLAGNERWYPSNRPCSESELCRPSLFVGQYSALSNLKYLRLCGEIDQKNFQMNQINLLHQLLELDIESCRSASFDLHLDQLQMLSLRWYNRWCEINLDCPKLRVLRYTEDIDKSRLRVEHPDTIRRLDSDMVGQKLTRFRNLGCLRRTNYPNRHFHGPADSSTLFGLEKLRAIHYEVELIGASFNLEEPKEVLQEFMQQRRARGRSDLQVYFAGLLLIADDLSDLGLEIENEANFLSAERLYMRHYDRLETEMEFIQSVNYNILFGSVQRLPDDYFRRFFNLGQVVAACPFDEQHFLQFLRKIHHLHCLTLYVSELSQTFFDSLSELHSLTQLMLFYSNDSRSNEIEESENQLDFSFVGELTKLCSLRVDLNLSLASVRSILTSFGRLTNAKSCTFKLKDSEFQMVKWRVHGEPDDKFDLIKRNRLMLHHVRLARVLDYLEKSFLNSTFFTSL